VKISQKLKEEKRKIPGRGSWTGVDPRTKVIKPKKGRGSYRRINHRGLEQIKSLDLNF
jgi:hypothetical protein